MELKTNYQYTYFIYPFAIKEGEYRRYVANLIKNKRYKIKFFDAFKDVELYKYFVPTIKEKLFQDFSFSSDKINSINKLSMRQKIDVLSKQNCLMFEYVLEEQMQGKIDEKDGIFFSIPKIELICFNTGICFLSIKTHLVETEKFSDVLNFNYKFENINLENKNIKKLDTIKIQTNMFNNMSKISEIISDITGQKIESRKLDIDDDLFLIYTYACIDSSYWNKEADFESIENEFVKLAELKPSDINVNVDYDKLSVITNSSFRKIRINNKCVATMCSSTDTENYTKFYQEYESKYLYTYIIALHQRYYLKKLGNSFNKNTNATINNFINFTNNIWISEVTTDSLGEKIYKRCKEKLNLEDIFNDVKKKYDIYYKKLNIEKNKNINKILICLMLACVALGMGNLASWLFFK